MVEKKLEESLDDVYDEDENDPDVDNCPKDWYYLESFKMLNKIDLKIKSINAGLNEANKDRIQVLKSEIDFIATNEMMYFNYYQKELIYWDMQIIEDEDAEQHGNLLIIS
jgi:agmatine/peptidylarginine deiminase